MLITREELSFYNHLSDCNFNKFGIGFAFWVVMSNIEEKVSGMKSDYIYSIGPR